MLAVVSPAHRLAKRRYVEAADFAPEHLILHRVDRRLSFTFSRILAPARVEPARVSEVPLTEAILELIKAGMGIGVLVGWAIDPRSAQRIGRGDQRSARRARSARGRRRD